MHMFGFLGSLMFIFGFISVVIIGANKLYNLTNGLPYTLITDSPYFYLALTLMILGTQLFLAGFIGELIARNAPERNNYKIEEEFENEEITNYHPIVPDCIRILMAGMQRKRLSPEYNIPCTFRLTEQ